MTKAPLLSWALPARDAGPIAWPSARPARLPAELLARWRSALQAWEAPEASRAALETLSRPDAEVIVTGQQPGFWGGPLYCVYKAATAVALAERRARATGRPAVAVFWINADDTDWDEIGWGALPRPDLSLYRARWPSPLGSRRWVGGAPVSAPADSEEVFAAWGRGGALLGGPRGAQTLELGDAFARTLLAGFGDRGLVPLDARWAEVRAAGEPLWRDYLDRAEAIAAAVRAEGEALARAGAPVPLDEDAAHSGLFVLDGDHRLPLDRAAAHREARALLDAGQADRLAPSVLLRAILQDRMFGTAAHVVGDAEAAYLRQLAPAYATLGVRPPARVARLQATIVPEGLAPLDRLAEVCADPEAWVGEASRALIPARATAALAELRRSVTRGLDEASAASGDFLKDMEQLAASAAAKMDGQVHRLEEALDRRARQRLYQERPELRHLPEFLRPRRALQERGLCAATLALFFGERAPDAALSAARAHLDRLDEGALHHFLLEGSRG